MTETLTLRDLPQVAPPEAPAVAKTSAIATGIANVQSEVAKFDQIAAGLRAIESAHPKNVIVGAIETSAGMKVAEAGWRAYRNPRLEVERARKAAKQPVLALGRAIDDFAGQLESTLREGEDHYKAQIDAETARQEAARRERERIEAERVAKIRETIAGFAMFVARCQEPGMTAERISKGIDILQNLPVTEAEFAEFYQEALTVKVETLAEMNRLHVAAVAREEEAARVEAQRQENERQAAELARQRAELQRQADELAAARAEAERRQQEIEAAQQRADAAGRSADLGTGETPAPGQRETPPNAQEEVPLPGTPGLPVPTSEAAPVVGSSDEGEAAHAEERAADPVPLEAPTLRLSDIAERLSFIVGEKLMTRLGFESTTVRSARLYRESDWPAICDAIIKHVKAVRDQ